MSTYPEIAADRDRWILSRRSPRPLLNSREPVAFFAEDEYSAAGIVEPVATIFLTNRECPFRCVMCDLWRNTLSDSVSSGAIPAQIDFALDRLPSARVIKLYNSGSFLDPRAIPAEDYAAIAELLQAFDRVIVESHPAFVGPRCVEFRNLLAGKLEIAMGLETAHPAVLDKLNKRMTLEQFAAAGSFLQANGMDLRVFILVQPPFMKPEEALQWAQRSLDFAFNCGATAATLLPTRGGNGAMEALAEAGEFARPSLATLEEALTYGLSLRRGRVFADLWDLRTDDEVNCCFRPRIERLRQMNLRQQVANEVTCDVCGSHN